MEELLDDYELENISEFEHAGFWNRLAASLIDALILGVPLWLIIYVIGLNDDQLITNVISIISNWLYNALQITSGSQATIGKKALGIKVVGMNGEKISFANATGRFFGKYISSIILGIGFLMAGFTEKKQALHDIMASTLVIKD